MEFLIYNFEIYEISIFLRLAKNDPSKFNGWIDEYYILYKVGVDVYIIYTRLIPILLIFIVSSHMVRICVLGCLLPCSLGLYSIPIHWHGLPIDEPGIQSYNASLEPLGHKFMQKLLKKNTPVDKKKNSI